MLVEVLKELKEYNNIVITLDAENHFDGEVECKELVCIHAPSIYSMPVGIFRLRKLIKKYNPVLVHSHLPIPNFLARIAVHKSIPLVNTIHTSIAHAADYQNKYIRLIDKLTYQIRKIKIIAVSKVALNEYFSVLKLKLYNPSVLYTFVDINKFKPSFKKRNPHTEIKLVTVGSYKSGKNIPYLIEVFKKLRDEDISLHIFGRGHEQIKKQIEDAKVNIFLSGQHKNMQEILPEFDAFIMPSKFEGFSLSVLEAMAVKLPLLLSDIPSFKEQAQENALYFKLSNTEDGYTVIMNFILDRKHAMERAENAYKLMEDNYTLQHHISGLKKIYLEVLTE